MENTITPLSGLSWPNVQYFSTTRAGGVSQGPYQGLNLGSHVGDDPESVQQNRQRLTQLCPAEPLWLEQVHSIVAVDADQTEESTPIADAAVTTQRNRPLVVLTADCLPVVLSDEAGSVLGVAHAGWRGLAQGVLQSTITLMRQKQPQLQRLRAWIGPAISQKHFEVGAEVRQAFMHIDPSLAMYFVDTGHNDKHLADLPSIARHLLINTYGEKIEVALSGECTFEQNERYYSYRHSPVTGRLATVAWLTYCPSDKGSRGE